MRHVWSAIARCKHCPGLVHSLRTGFSATRQLAVICACYFSHISFVSFFEIHNNHFYLVRYEYETELQNPLLCTELVEKYLSFIRYKTSITKKSIKITVKADENLDN